MQSDPRRPEDAANRTADPADHDYQGGEVNRPGFVRDLAARIDGEVRFDEYIRQLYATDASIYKMTDWLLNPGQVVFRDEDPTEMTEDLRHGPDYAFDAGFEPTLDWSDDGGF